MYATDTRRRPRRHRESDEMAAFLGRLCRAMIRRAGAGDLGALAALVQLRATVDQAITQAGAELHAGGLSYTVLGAELGITRQSARERFTRAPASPDAHD
jgi:hypothetical protein